MACCKFNFEKCHPASPQVFSKVTFPKKGQEEVGKKQKERDKVIKLGSGGAGGDGGRQGARGKKGSGGQDRLTKVLRKGGDKRQRPRDNPHTFLSSIESE